MPVSRPGKPCHVKGNALTTRIKWLRLYYGEDGVARIRGAVSDDLAQLLDHGARMADWYPFAFFVELNEAIDQTFGDGDLALVRELGRYGAEANLTTIYRLFFKAGTVKWIMARATRLWGMHYDTGQLLVREFLGNEIEVEIRDFAQPCRVHCVSVQGWIERAGELSGASDIVLREVGCRALADDRCRFRFTWH